MVRLSELPEYEREHLLAKNMPPLGPAVWTEAKSPLSALRIALITTAGLHYRDAAAFAFADSTFRPIDSDEDPDQLVMSHSSVNFDKSGFTEDVNLVFPIQRFKELATKGIIGSVASVHYSFMGGRIEGDGNHLRKRQRDLPKRILTGHTLIFIQSKNWQIYSNN